MNRSTTKLNHPRVFEEARQAVIKLTTLVAFIDLLITDISMPNEEGLGLIRAMRKACPATKIIALSGTDPETLRDAKLLGAQAALRKPVAADVVLQCIRELVATTK